MGAVIVNKNPRYIVSIPCALIPFKFHVCVHYFLAGDLHGVAFSMTSLHSLPRYFLASSNTDNSYTFMIALIAIFLKYYHIYF